MSAIGNGKAAERLAKRKLEDIGFEVHDANIIFQVNCPNIDLVVYARTGAVYVQVKATNRPAGVDCLIVDGSGWTTGQLLFGDRVFNKHDHFEAQYILLVGAKTNGEADFHVAPPAVLEQMAIAGARKWIKVRKKDGNQRSIYFRKELPRRLLADWHMDWHLLGEPVHQRVVTD